MGGRAANPPPLEVAQRLRGGPTSAAARLPSRPNEALEPFYAALAALLAAAVLRDLEGRQ